MSKLLTELYVTQRALVRMFEEHEIFEVYDTPGCLRRLCDEERAKLEEEINLSDSEIEQLVAAVVEAADRIVKFHTDSSGVVCGGPAVALSLNLQRLKEFQ